MYATSKTRSEERLQQAPVRGSDGLLHFNNGGVEYALVPIPSGKSTPGGPCICDTDTGVKPDEVSRSIGLQEGLPGYGDAVEISD